MILVLTISTPIAASHRFSEAGGSIGRSDGNSFVLPDARVSGLHVVISFKGGVFYISDTSRNGTAVNTLGSRLIRDRTYALTTGDRIFIEPYEIDVTVEEGDDLLTANPLAEHDLPTGFVGVPAPKPAKAPAADDENEG